MELYQNHYLLLFWGALDQVCWIVNGVCNLGFQPNQWRKVGVGKDEFLKRLAASDPNMVVEFQEPAFLRWISVLKTTRHYVAHQGTARLSPLLESPASEPSDAEIDREIERWTEWRDLEQWLPRWVLETFRPTFRVKWKLQRYRQVSDAAFVIPGAADTALIFPLDNIEWEYERFRHFVLNVARKCMARLAVLPDAPKK